ncbi:MAG: hypothetical protein PVG22_09555 [Chromatiales bacterium]|jgi:hypothetical protein
MQPQPLFFKQVVTRHLIRAGLIAGIALLSACASTGNHVTGFEELHLAPGDTGNCESSPCQVFLMIPEGTGSYKVTGNGMDVGTYPAGQEAALGGFWDTQVLVIQGMDVPKTYAYIPKNR